MIEIELKLRGGLIMRKTINILCLFLFIIILCGCTSLMSTQSNPFKIHYKGKNIDEIKLMKDPVYKTCTDVSIVKVSPSTDLYKSLIREGYYGVGHSEFVSRPFFFEKDLQIMAKSLGACRVHFIEKFHGRQYPGGDYYWYAAVYGIKVNEQLTAGFTVIPASENIKLATGAAHAQQVDAVMKKSPSYFANIIEGDIIISFNGKPYIPGKTKINKGNNNVIIWRNGYFLNKNINLNLDPNADSSYIVLRENAAFDEHITKNNYKTGSGYSRTPNTGVTAGNVYPATGNQIPYVNNYAAPYLENAWGTLGPWLPPPQEMNAPILINAMNTPNVQMPTPPKPNRNKAPLKSNSRKNGQVQSKSDQFYKDVEAQDSRNESSSKSYNGTNDNSNYDIYESAQNGDDTAQYYLGMRLIASGKVTEGIEWLRKASLKNKNAQKELEKIYIKMKAGK